MIRIAYLLSLSVLVALPLAAACKGDSPQDQAAKRLAYLHDTIRPINLIAGDVGNALRGSSSLNYEFRGEGVITALSGENASVQKFPAYAAYGLEVAYWQDFGPDAPVSDRPSTLVSSVAVYASEAGAADAQKAGPRLYASLPLFPAYKLSELFASPSVALASPDHQVWLLQAGGVIDYAVLDVRAGRLIGALIFPVPANTSPTDPIYASLARMLGEKLSKGVPAGFAYPP